MVQTWRLKNSVEVQDLNKNLFLFKFSSKKDADHIFETGLRSFNRNLLILDEISGEEQPSELDLHTVPFWKLIRGNITEWGSHSESKVALNLGKALKRGTILKY